MTHSQPYTALWTIKTCHFYYSKRQNSEKLELWKSCQLLIDNLLDSRLPVHPQLLDFSHFQSAYCKGHFMHKDCIAGSSVQTDHCPLIGLDLSAAFDKFVPETLLEPLETECRDRNIADMDQILSESPKLRAVHCVKSTSVTVRLSSSSSGSTVV